jgi:DNA-binding MarR family transcriptional regulator
MSPFELIDKVSLQLNQQMLLELRLKGIRDIRPAHFFILKVLQADAMRLTQITRFTPITKQSVKYLLDYLEQHYYVERKPDKTDGRAYIYKLTRKGKKAAEEIDKNRNKINQQVKNMLGEMDFAFLVSSLSKIEEHTTTTVAFGQHHFTAL